MSPGYKFLNDILSILNTIASDEENNFDAIILDIEDAIQEYRNGNISSVEVKQLIQALLGQ